MVKQVAATDNTMSAEQFDGALSHLLPSLAWLRTKPSSGGHDLSAASTTTLHGST